MKTVGYLKYFVRTCCIRCSWRIVLKFSESASPNSFSILWKILPVPGCIRFYVLAFSVCDLYCDCGNSYHQKEEEGEISALREINSRRTF